MRDSFAVWLVLMAGRLLCVDTQQVYLGPGRFFGSYNVEVRVTLDCNTRGPDETSSMDICPLALSLYTRSVGVREVTITGDALKFNDMLSPNPLLWIGMYFSDNMRRTLISESTPASASGYICETGSNWCMKRMVCTIKEEFWGVKPNSNQVVVLSSTDRYIMQGADGSSMEVGFGPLSHTCVMCAPAPCTDAELSCPNGNVVDSTVPHPELTSAKLDTNGRPPRFNKPDCPISCPQGTWLTCMEETSCSYIAPSQATITRVQIGNQAQLNRAQIGNRTDLLVQKALTARIQLRDNEILQWVRQNKASTGLTGTGADVPVSLDWGVPFDTCYPCSLAANRKHFGRLTATDTALQSQGFLQFECPGGDLGPRICSANEVSLIDNVTLTSSPCKCKPGLYRDAQDHCSPCSAGYRCPFGATFAAGMQQCPVDTYSRPGSSACTPCSKDTGACTSYQALTRCSGAEYQTSDSVCVDCNHCVEVSGPDVGGVPCLNLVSSVG